MRKFADMLKGRVTLELLHIPGSQEQRFEEMGANALCAAIELMTEIDDLREFGFLPRDLVATMNNTLFNVGQLISALLNLSLQRIDAFFGSLALLDTGQRPTKLPEIVRIVSESLQAVHIDNKYPALFRTLLLKLVTSQLLSFSDQLSMLSFDDFEEAAIVLHINCCEKVKELFLGSRINVAAQVIESPGSAASEYLPMPSAILDAVSSACNTSAKKAALRAVQNMKNGAADLLVQGVQQDKTSQWLAGGFCTVLIDRLYNWVVGFTGNLHPKYTDILLVETCRLVITVYVNNMIVCYKGNKSIKVSKEGIHQLILDLQTIHSWTIEHINPQLVQFEVSFLLMLIQFLFSTHENLITCFSDSVQLFGLQHALHIYDMLRLMLKYRMDLTANVRHSVLGLCGEFLLQLQGAVLADPSLICGEVAESAARTEVTVLDALCPKAGVEHCTGKKWRVEVLPDPVPVRLTVALLVNQVCNGARQRRCDQLREQHTQEPKTLEDAKPAEPSPAVVAEQKAPSGGAAEPIKRVDSRRRLVVNAKTTDNTGHRRSTSASSSLKSAAPPAPAPVGSPKKASSPSAAAVRPRSRSIAANRKAPQRGVSCEVLLDQALLSSEEAIGDLHCKLLSLRTSGQPAAPAPPSAAPPSSSSAACKPPPPPKPPKKPAPPSTKLGGSKDVEGIAKTRSTNPFDEDIDGPALCPEHPPSTIEERSDGISPKEAFVKLLEAAKKDLVFDG